MVETPTAPPVKLVRVTVDEVDLATIGEFRTQLRCHAPGPHLLVVDLSEVTFVDVQGATELLALAHEHTEAGGVVELRNEPSCVRRLLGLLDPDSRLLAP
jgi:anti-anti-sigma regulatory factor